MPGVVEPEVVLIQDAHEVGPVTHEVMIIRAFRLIEMGGNTLGL